MPEYTEEDKTMKDGIHPTYYHDALVTCACGNSFTTGSTSKAMRIDVCAKCHPFYTGQQRIIDTGGQVERFMKRQRRVEGSEKTAAVAD
jgi:large subunit ribosomal protein L31